MVRGVLAINQPELAQCGLERRRRARDFFRSEYGPVFGFEKLSDWHVNPSAARRT